MGQEDKPPPSTLEARQDLEFTLERHLLVRRPRMRKKVTAYSHSISRCGCISPIAIHPLLTISNIEVGGKAQCPMPPTSILPIASNMCSHCVPWIQNCIRNVYKLETPPAPRVTVIFSRFSALDASLPPSIPLTIRGGKSRRLRAIPYTSRMQPVE